MDFLLKTLTPLNVVLALFLCLGAAFAMRHADYPAALYRQWRYPPQNFQSAQGREILAKAEEREMRRVENKFQRIASLLKQSQAEGFEIDVLEVRAQEALKRNVPGLREEAIQRLNELEMDIPRKKVQYIPMSGVER